MRPVRRLLIATIILVLFSGGAIISVLAAGDGTGRRVSPDPTQPRGEDTVGETHPVDLIAPEPIRSGRFPPAIAAVPTPFPTPPADAPTLSPRATETPKATRSTPRMTSTSTVPGALAEPRPTPPPSKALMLSATTPVALPAPTPPSETVSRPTPAVLGTCFKPWAAGDSVHTIDSAGGSRSYRLHVPPSYGTAGPVALVFDFHGYAQNAQQEEQYSGLTTIADREGFIVVTPEGSSSPRGWNIVGVYAEDGVNDVQFVRDLLASLSVELCVDLNRVYATGHSNGAEMASQLACSASDIFAAAAPVSGVVWQGCADRPVPMVAFQGTADLNFQYDWSAAAIPQWADYNGCNGPPVASAVSVHVTAETWQGCLADTTFYIIDGGGHTWPGSTAPGGAGPVTTEINASELIWTFFADHARQ